MITWIRFITLIWALVMTAFTLFTYPRLPETVPIHIGLSGDADAWGSRAEVLAMLAVFAAISCGFFWISGSAKLLVKPDEEFPERAKRRARIAGQTIATTNVGVVIGFTGLLLTVVLGWNTQPLLIAGAIVLFGSVLVGVWRTLRA